MTRLFIIMAHGFFIFLCDKVFITKSDDSSNNLLLPLLSRDLKLSTSAAGSFRTFSLLTLVQKGVARVVQILQMQTWINTH